jgi:hypothetical protein
MKDLLFRSNGTEIFLLFSILERSISQGHHGVRVKGEGDDGADSTKTW